MFTLEIVTDNASFDEAPQAEIVRALEEIIGAIVADVQPFIARRETASKLRDSNGNTIGYWRFTP